MFVFINVPVFSLCIRFYDLPGIAMPTKKNQRKKHNSTSSSKRDILRGPGKSGERLTNTEKPVLGRFVSEIEELLRLQEVVNDVENFVDL